MLYLIFNSMYKVVKNIEISEKYEVPIIIQLLFQISDGCYHVYT